MKNEKTTKNIKGLVTWQKKKKVEKGFKHMEKPN